ncbi:MAG: AMP-binding protein [Magnetococcales bacterium]|nr:AMP-binding protein [Magnetococcales bacterium]
MLEIRRWALRLQNHPEPVVAIFGRMTPSMMGAWFGAILAGKLPTFMAYPSRKIQQEDYVSKLTNYRERFQKCLFVGEALDRVHSPDLLSPTDKAHDFEPGWVAIPEFSPNTPLFLQCSSGTTGLQKAVAITTEMLEAQVKAYAATLALDPNQDRIISWLPLYHDMGLAGVFLLALLTKTPLHLLDTFEWAANPSWLLEVIARERGTLCWLPNFAFSLLAKKGGKYDLDSMRSFVNCSEPVSVGAFERFMAAFEVDHRRLSVCYALAENVFAATQTPVGRSLRIVNVDRMALARRQLRISQDKESMAVFGCGYLLPGVSLKLDRRNEEEEIGEILLKGACTVLGYYNHPPLREDGWLPTGDLGFLQDGELFVCGRIKDLIIHNGKNIHPLDVEERASRHPEVYPGRVVAMGRMDESLDSEQVLLLFEPVRFLQPTARREVCQAIRQELDTLFDSRFEVDCVPRQWLRKTTSGKMARQENLRRYLTASRTEVHVIGDSHVRIFWSGPTSHHDRYRRVHAHWLGLLWSGNWKQTLAFFVKLVSRLNATDVIILQFGEPECRSIFPVAVDPEARIQLAVDSYREFFQVLRHLWPGRLAYMTGIPTHPCNIDNGDNQWPIRSTPEVRYHWQKRFYQAMYSLCTELAIHFLDVCTPLLGADGFMDPLLLCDKAHLDPAHEGIVLELLENHFGYLDLTPNLPPPESQVWDGSYAHYLELMQQKIREISPMLEESDWDHLVSGGFLDSLSIVELIAMLDKTFHFNLDPATLQRIDFESIANMWARFGPKG